jgi:hypothetical protein
MSLGTFGHDLEKILKNIFLLNFFLNLICKRALRPDWQGEEEIEKSTLPRTCPFDLKLRKCDLIDILNTKFYGFTSKFGV